MDKLKSPILFYIVTAIVLGMLSILDIEKCRKHSPKKVSNTVKKAKGLLMFNSILRFTMQTFFTISISSFINIKYSVSESIIWTNIAIQLAAIAILLCFTIYFKLFLQWNEAKLGLEKFKGTFGALYINVEY